MCTSSREVFIPAASVGPAQEITQLLLTAMEARQIRKVPISLDGQVRQVMAAYESMLDSLPPALRERQELTGRPVFLHDPVRLVKDRDERARLINQDQPAIVIASGTTLATGAARAYARAWLTESGNHLFLSRDRNAESPSRRLLEYTPGRAIIIPDDHGHGEAITHPISLPAHSDRGGLISLISRYKPGRPTETRSHAATWPVTSIAKRMSGSPSRAKSRHCSTMAVVSGPSSTPIPGDLRQRGNGMNGKLSPSGATPAVMSCASGCHAPLMLNCSARGSTPWKSCAAR